MMSYPRLGWSGARALASLVALGIALFSAVTVQAAPQYDYKCDDCHRMPPRDSGTGTRDPEIGAFKGNHESHSGSSAATCVKCHGPELTSAAHRDKTIQVTGNINSSPRAATYNRVGFINQTSFPPNPLGTCSNVNCHFEAPSPTWGTKSYQVPAACNECHLLILDSGNHRKHTSYYGSGVDSCAKCHPDHGKEQLPFRHATSATSRGIAVSFATPKAGGSYSGDGTNFLPSQGKTSFGSCSAVYCHSNGVNGAPNTPAAWGGSPLPADCTGCHGGNASAAIPANILATGSHGKHINNANAGSGTNLGSNYRCFRCHKETMDAANDLVVLNKAGHIDANAEVSFSDGGGYGGGVCSTTMCHGAGKAAAPAAPAPSWGGAALDCKGCHGVGSSYGEPNYANAGAGLDLANSHGPKHVTGPSSCVNCHASTTSDGLTIVNGSTSHTDGVLTVNFASAIDLGGASYNGALDAKTCSSTYCHSDGNGGQALEATKWGGTTNCLSCHGGDAASGSPVPTYLHPSHLKNYSTLGRGNVMMCAECHAKTVGIGSNTILTNSANHLNRFKDYSAVRGGGSAGYSGGVCSNVYCHSTGEKMPAFRNMTGSKAWNGSAKLGCDGCHGYGGEATVAGEPNYTSRQGAENSHKAHTSGANMADSRGCAVCHRTTVDAGVKNKLRDYSSAHLNGVRDVTFAVIANYTGHYDATSKSCSNTYCHGQGASDVWGAPGPLLCDRCHGASSSLSGAHRAHWQDSATATSYVATPGNPGGTATAYRFECSSCHSGSHAQGPLANGYAAEVFFNYTSKNLPGHYDYGTGTSSDGNLKWSNGKCTNTYCHSRGEGSEGFDTNGMTWASPDKTLRCNGCHGGAYGGGKPNPIDTNLHKNHLDPGTNLSLGAGNGLKCGACHALTVSFANDTTVIDKRRHVNKFREYSGLLAGNSTSYDQKNKTCNTIYCHSNGKRGTPVNEFKAPGLWTSPGSMGCNGCHGSATAYDFPGDSMGTPNYANGGEGTPNANSHKAHIQKMVNSSTNVCYVCHARTVDKYADKTFRPYSTTHLSDGTTHVTFGQISTAGFKLMNPEVARYTGKTCSTVTCHSNGKGVYQDAKWGAPGNCAMCHPMNTLSRGHIYHVYTSATNTPTFYNNYTANLSTGSRYNYGCGNCHPLNNPGHAKGTVLIDMTPGSADVVGLLRSRNNGSMIYKGNVVAGTTGSGTSWSNGDLVCNNVYCHSNGFLTTPVYQETPGWYSGNFSGDKCAACHGNAPNSNGSIGSPSHYNNKWLGTDNNAGGHLVGIHAGNIVNGVNFTGMLTPGSTDPSSHGATPTVTPTTISCNTCHYGVIVTSANSGSAQCASCHTLPAAQTKALAAIDNKKLHVNGSVSVQFMPGPLYSKAQLKDPSFEVFSSAFMMRVNGYKDIRSYDVSKINLNAGSYAGGGNCTTICHFNKPVRWDNTPAVTCSSCHQSL